MQRFTRGRGWVGKREERGQRERDNKYYLYLYYMIYYMIDSYKYAFISACPLVFYHDHSTWTHKINFNYPTISRVGYMIHENHTYNFYRL